MTPAPEGDRHATILIVDDASANRDFLAAVLRHQGHRLLEASDGGQGLAAARAHRPDLVITDVLMPVMDGYELVRQLRLDPATSGIPVVFYTAHYGEREARALALASGVSEVLTKPAETASVLAMVARVLAGEPAAATSPPSPLTTAFDREHLRLLADKLSEKAGDLRTANARLRALINIALEFSSEGDTDRRLQSVCASACDLFGATYVSLGILERDGRVVQRVVTCGMEAPAWLRTGDEVPALLAPVVAERRTLRSDPDGGGPAAPQLPALHSPVQAFLAVPIASAAHVYGWICLVGNDGRAFTDDDEQLVMALAGQVGRICELEHEILERKQMAAALSHERDRARRYLDTAEVILLALDLDGRVTLLNRKGCDVIGWTERELRGCAWIDTCLPARIRDGFRQTFRDRLVAGDLPVGENPILTRAGEERLIEWRHTLLHDEAGTVVGTLSSGADITDRRALEAQYQHAQKMEAVGQLAGGIAHDFNNVLTGILGYCELLLADRDPVEQRHADIMEIQKAGEHAAALTRQLLAFSRKQIIEPALLDLNVVTGDMRPMLTRLIREDVQIVLALCPEGARVRADRGQLEQVVLNLAVNARDAMPAGGSLTIETRNIKLDAHDAARHTGVMAGPYVALTVTDTGAGMSPEVQARLFEPFFTTKAIGRGTGLGLAIVHGIVTRSGGSVSVRSAVGQGTTLTVYFPRAAAEEMDSVPATAAAPPPAGLETVLVVEDEVGIRALLRRMLETQGYTALVAASAEEAMACVERDASIDVILADVVMPGSSGPEAIRQMADRRPSLKVIYMSGYSEEAIRHDGVTGSAGAFLHKPFTAEALGRKIREALNPRVGPKRR